MSCVSSCRWVMKIMNVQENVHHTCSYNLSNYLKHYTAYQPAGTQLLFDMENCSFKLGMTDINRRRVNICVKYYFLKQFLNSDSETCDKTNEFKCNCLPIQLGTVSFHWAKALGTEWHRIAFEPCSR